jgi:hypothetical protein
LADQSALRRYASREALEPLFATIAVNNRLIILDIRIDNNLV